jgi:hypothetical protein
MNTQPLEYTVIIEYYHSSPEHLHGFYSRAEADNRAACIMTNRPGVRSTRVEQTKLLTN